MSAFFSAGASFTPSPVMATICLLAWIRLDQAELVLGACPSEHVDVSHLVPQGRLVHLLDLGAGDGGLAVADAQHLGDRRRRDPVIAGDHGHANAAAVAFAHGVDGFLARRIEEADQAKQDEVVRQVGGSEAARLAGRALAPRESQNALALAGQLVGSSHEVRAIERCRLAGRRLLAVAVLEDDLGRTLDQEKLLTLRRLVERRHELVLRFERDGIDPRRCGELGLAAEAELGRERVERALGRIALDSPGTLLLEQLRVIAQHGHAAHECQHRLVVDGLVLLPDLAFGRIAVAGDLVRRFGGDGGHHHHFHERERAGLVGADARYRPQGFDRRQLADDGVALGHALHADRERDRDDRRQALRNHRHRNADHGLEQLDEVHALHPLAVGEHQDADDSDDGGDDVAELLDLAQQRRLERADAGEQGVDAAELRRAAGRHDHAGRATGHDHRARERHAFPIADRRIGRRRLGVLVGRDRFAGERRLLGAEILHVDQPQVGRNLVAGFEQHDVARHQLLRRDQARLATAQGSRFGRQHVADRIQRLLRLALLDEAEHAVENDHAEDDRGIDPQAQHQLGETGAQQDVDEDIVELGEEPHDGSSPLAFRQSVGSVLAEPGRGLAGVQPSVPVGAEPFNDLASRHRMPRHSVAGRGRVRRCVHGRAPRLLARSLTKPGPDPPITDGAAVAGGQCQVARFVRHLGLGLALMQGC
jgi:hypothetical protein